MFVSVFFFQFTFTTQQGMLLAVLTIAGMPLCFGLHPARQIGLQEVQRLSLNMTNFDYEHGRVVVRFSVLQ